VACLLAPQVANASLPAGERINKNPIFIKEVDDTRAFLAWLRASCPRKLTAQLKAEKLVVFPSTAEGFRAADSALRFLDGNSGVRFHTYSLPEDRCVRLLIKHLGKMMRESVVLAELGSLGIRFQGVMQLRSGQQIRIRPRTVLPPPTSLCLWHGARRCPGCGPS
jgi:hypothetical protein